MNGRDFSGWKSVRVTRGIDAICGGFDLEVTDRWAGQDQAWPIRQGDDCKLKINGEVVITGYVDKRSISFSATEHTLRVSGRDKASALLDCSAGISAPLSESVKVALGVTASMKEVLGPWEFRSLPLLELARRLAKPHGISVSLAPGLVLPTPPAKFTIDPGEGAFDALDRACKAAGVLPVSDGAGGVVLTRPGADRLAVTALVQGQNILGASAEYDSSSRFARYVVLGQHHGSDEYFGAAVASVSGEARDAEIRRTQRQLIIRPEGAVTREYAKRRAEWEAIVRAGRAASVNVTVQGWTQGDGSPWPVNALVQVISPMLELPSGSEMLITQAVHELSDRGTTTQLTLRRPDAYRPEPTIERPAAMNAKVKPWEEIQYGA